MPRSALKKIVDITGPSLALQEFLYGFIMALLFVTAARAGVLAADRTGLILLIIGMNFTWGAIDMIIFTLVDTMDQRHYVNIVNSKDRVDDDAYVERIIKDELSGTLVDILDDEDAKGVIRHIMSSRLEPEEDLVRERHDMIRSGFACFLITMLTTIPVILPILLIPNLSTGLAVASMISSVCLFFIGYLIAPYIGRSKWLTGLVITAFAWALTIAGTFTGG